MNRFASFRSPRVLSLSLILAVFLAVTVLTTWTGRCQAQEPASNLFFIFDASGSMWGQIKGRAKIAIAKEVLKGLIKDLPDGTRVGLMAYGHRKKGDCNDVEELAPLGPLNKGALIKKIEAINPKGKTPITLSIQKTARKLKTVEEETNIILVSDGKETCAGDPCALVKELRESGAKFVMHVVGFDVTEEENKQLGCIAKAGGGNYYAAKDASQLRKALDKVMKEALAENLIIHSVSTAGWPIGAKVQVLKAGTTEQVGALDGERISFKLPAGAYDVTARLKLDEKQMKTLTGLEVKKYEKLERKVVFSVGRLGGWAKDAAGKPALALITILRTEDGQEKRITSGKSREEPQLFDVVPGTYKMVLTDDKTKQEKVIENIQVGEGQEVIKEISFGQARLGGWAKDAAGQPVFALITIFRVEDEKEKRITHGKSRKEPLIFDVAPGTYKMVLTDEKTKQENVIKNIQVGEGQEVIKETSFAQGRLGVWAKDTTGKPIVAYIRVLRVENGQDRNVAGGDSVDKPRFFDVAPGTYKIILMDRMTQEKKIIENIKVEGGQEVVKETSFGQARLGVWVKDAAGKPIAATIRVLWVKGGQEGNVAGGESMDKPRFFDLAPGTYKIILRDRGTKQEKVVENIRLDDRQEVIKEVRF